MDVREQQMPAIKSVQVVTTGTAEQHKEHRYGTRLPRMVWVLMSRSWVKIPINAFLITHRDGLVLFDTGIDPSIATDPGYISSPIGRFLLPKIFRFHISPDDSLAHRLKAMSIEPSDIRKAVISHLHFDHVGGIADIPQAELLVCKDEWQRLARPQPERDWILREHIELPDAKWRQIEFSQSEDPLLSDFPGYYDVMGDGSLVCLPTPGHTSGSMSLLLRSEGTAPLLFVGDLTYEQSLLMNDQVAGVGDGERLKASFAQVRALMQKLPDLAVIPSHDPSVTETIRQYNLAITNAAA